MKYYIGFRISRKVFFDWWPEGPEEAFDKGAWIITESQKYTHFAEFTIIDTSVEFSEKQAKAIMNLTDFFDARSITPIIKRKDETPHYWTLYQDGKEIQIEV